MASYSNKISILLTAQDEASAVIAEASAQVEEAQEQLSAASSDSTAVQEANADRVVDAQQTIAAGAESGSARVVEAQQAMLLNNDELATSFLSLGASADEYSANLAIIAAATKEAVGDITVMGATTVDENGAIIASNDDLILSYRELAATQDTATGSSDLVQGFANRAGVGGLLSSPYVLAGAAITAATVEVVKQAANFQQQLTKLYTTAGETAPLGQLSAAISQVADATGASVSELTQAQYYISSAGYTALGGVNILKAAAEGAQAEGANVTDVANALTTVMHDYGANSDQATSYMNQLIGAVSEGKMTLQDFSTALSTVLLTGHQAGLTFAQVAGAVATLTEAGVSAQEATQNVRSLIQELSGSNITSTEVENMQNYGLSVTQLEQNLGSEGLTGTLQEVTTALDKYDQGGVIIQQTMQNATIAQQKMTQEMKAMPPQLQSLTQQLVNGQISFADYRTEVQALPEGLTNLGKEFESTYNQANSFNTLLTGNTPAVQTYIAALKGLFGNQGAEQAVLALTSNMGKSVENVNRISEAAQDAGDSIAGWSKITQNLNIQMDRVWQTIQTGARGAGDIMLPILTRMADGFATVAGDYIDISDELMKIYGDVPSALATGFDASKSFLGSLLTSVGGDADSLYQQGLSMGEQLASGIAQAVADSPSNTVQWGDDIVTAVKRGFDDVVRDAPQWGRDAIKAYEQGLTDLAAYDLNSLLNWEHAADQAYQQGLSDGESLLKGVWAAIDQSAKDDVQEGRDILDGINSGFVSGMKAFTTGGMNIIRFIRSGLDEQMHSIGDFFMDLPGRIASQLTSSGQKVADQQVNGMSSAFRSVGEMKNLGDAILKGMAIAVGAVVVGILVLFVSLGIAIVNAIDQGVKDSDHLLAEAISGLWDVMAKAFEHLGTDIMQWTTDVVDEIVSVFETLPGRIGSALTSAGSSFVKDIGHDLHIPGFAAGTSSAPGGLAVVGENGPELVNLPSGSQVLSNAESNNLLGSSGQKGVVIQNVNIYNDTDVGLVVRQIGWQLANAV